MATHGLRIIDTGVGEGRHNIALGQALVDAHRAGDAADTLRFLRFPPTAIVGRHQALSHEVNLDYCRRNGVGLARRITGGGAIYLDEGQLGWELAINRGRFDTPRLKDVTRQICTAAARGLSKLGVDVRYRPRNDLEVDGRKIGGTGGFFDGDTLFFQGTVLVDLDAADMIAVLNIPAAKLAKRELDSARHRIVTLTEILHAKTPGMAEIQQALVAGMAEGLGLTPVSGSFTGAERAKAREYLDEEIGRDEFVFGIDDPAADRKVRSGSHTCAGGTITAHLRLEGPGQDRIREIVFTGDFFFTPPRLLLDLEARLGRALIDEASDIIEGFFARADTEVLSVTPEDFFVALDMAVSGQGARAAFAQRTTSNEKPRASVTAEIQ